MVFCVGITNTNMNIVQSLLPQFINDYHCFESKDKTSSLSLTKCFLEQGKEGELDP